MEPITQFTVEGNIQAVNSIFGEYQIYKNGAISSESLSLRGSTFTDVTQNPNATVPVITGMVSLPADTIKKQAQENGSYYKAKTTLTIQGQTMSLNSPIYAEGDLKITAESYSGNGMIGAKGSRGGSFRQ
jgi:hypothetical protein